MIIFILVVRNNAPKELTFVEVITHETLYVLIHVRDYSQAFHIVRSFKPDCFLLEENLALISGLQLCTQLRAQPGLEQVPTVVTQFDSVHATIPASGETILTIPHLRTLLEIIDKMILFSSAPLLCSFSATEMAGVAGRADWRQDIVI